jgi:hypothetical protein
LARAIRDCGENIFTNLLNVVAETGIDFPAVRAA